MVTAENDARGVKNTALVFENHEQFARPYSGFDLNHERSLSDVASRATNDGRKSSAVW